MLLNEDVAVAHLVVVIHFARVELAELALRQTFRCELAAHAHFRDFFVVIAVARHRTTLAANELGPQVCLLFLEQRALFPKRSVHVAQIAFGDLRLPFAAQLDVIEEEARRQVRERERTDVVCGPLQAQLIAGDRAATTEPTQIFLVGVGRVFSVAVAAKMFDFEVQVAEPVLKAALNEARHLAVRVDGLVRLADDEWHLKLAFTHTVVLTHERPETEADDLVDWVVIAHAELPELKLQDRVRLQQQR
mmetsp:Transcript_28050/g.86905  ORF Transcript_28050/g.86905 Transcript_28050/m.86905 type:complete len:248 (-) Transcript_28050:803-1546(-)